MLKIRCIALTCGKIEVMRRHGWPWDTWEVVVRTEMSWPVHHRRLTTMARKAVPPVTGERGRAVRGAGRSMVLHSTRRFADLLPPVPRIAQALQKLSPRTGG